ncbi:Tas Predicted oxidoreductases (related to aryl-alcohol dehydrogenases) [Candidatus Nanopelagicaceae bacterium]
MSNSEIQKIISDAITRENVFLETGPSYFGVEEKIGEVLQGKNFDRIIVKVPPSAFNTIEKFMTSVNESLKRLNREKIYAILLHGSKDAFDKYSKIIEEATKEVLTSQVAKRVGIACYDEVEVLTAKKTFPDMSIFQLPENVVDRRKIHSLELQRMHESGVIFQVRSIFLQGLLVGVQKDLPTELMELHKLRDQIEKNAVANGLTSRELCIQYAAGIGWASQIILGAENYQQYLENLETLTSTHKEITLEISKASDFVVDPRMWNWKNQ